MADIDFIPDIGFEEDNQSSSPQPSSNPGYFANLFKVYSPQDNPILNGILGAGDALRNTIASGANLIPGINIPMAKTGQGTAYNIGNIAGNIGGFFGGGELLDAARLGAEGIPYIGKALSALSDNPEAQNLVQQYLPEIARRAIGTGIYGVATNPNNMAKGGEEGIIQSLLADALPFGIGKISQGAQYFMPTSYMQKILNGLGGNKTLEDTTKSVINSVKDAYKSQTDEATKLYNPVFNQVGKNDIATANYNKLPDDITNLYPYDVKKLNSQFINNPTFDNAHQLQSQMGTEIRRLEGGRQAPDAASLNTIQALKDAQNAIQNDMKTHLLFSRPDLLTQYNKANNFFAQNVSPYRAESDFYKMASGETENLKPSSLADIFSAPGSNINKITGDLPQDSINKVIYTKLKQNESKPNPSSFINNYENLDRQGLNSYISPDLQDQISALKNRMAAKSILQGTIGAGLGAKATLGHGGLPLAAALGTLGYGVAKPILNSITNSLPINDLAQSLGNVTRGTYPYARNAVLANTLNGINQ